MIKKKIFSIQNFIDHSDMFPECEKKISIVIKIFDIIYMFPECEKKIRS
jgi:hypothetical protein